MPTPTRPTSVGMTCGPASPLKKKASPTAGTCFLTLPASLPSGPVSTNVLKKSSPTASRKLVPIDAFTLFELSLSQRTVGPCDGSPPSHISSVHR